MFIQEIFIFYFNSPFWLWDETFGSVVGEFKKNVTRQTWQALFHFGEYLFQSTRHFGECLKKMVSYTASNEYTSP